MYAVLDFFFPPAISVALVCLPILPFVRPVFLRSLPTAADAPGSGEVLVELLGGLLPRFSITVHAGAVSAALALAVLAGGLVTYTQRRAEGEDCRLHIGKAAVNAAVSKAQEAMKGELTKLTGGVNIPGLNDMLGGN